MNFTQYLSVLDQEFEILQICLRENDLNSLKIQKIHQNLRQQLINLADSIIFNPNRGENNEN